ncbi:MAG TPA: hypothetical protein PLO56_02625 [Rhodothermales bacterium]|nr:hypothetical protein [Rhodothermales bacterium]
MATIDKNSSSYKDGYNKGLSGKREQGTTLESDNFGAGVKAGREERQRIHAEEQARSDAKKSAK